MAVGVQRVFGARKSLERGRADIGDIGGKSDQPLLGGTEDK